ncbi:MAG: transaldolase [Geobacteraceae bacterium GWC2_58_44]|nr:MAG: transaldolase [Geobacteraceae bacterium GWC2_58_44]HBG06785.1 transaldolase [Geobacter sp.]
MRDNPLLMLARSGQSIWLDFLSRAMLVSGELVSLIQEDGVSGVTSNPATFERAIAGSADYDRAIAELARRGMSAAEIYQALVVDDIRMTADLLRPLYDRLDGRDGFVSLEVSPHLAHDSVGTLLEARRLWERVDRPNLLIKVPGTREGLAAIRQLVREGVNVNVTLLFGIPRYRAVAEAYLDGLSERAAHGLPMERVASVASFFLSRIDVLVDPLLAKLAQEEGRAGRMAASLRGETAIACAKVARKVYREILSEDRYLALAARGARPQRLLWASTGTKDPSYSDLKYVEALIGPDTVNTAPLETLTAYRDHGHPAPRLEQGLQEALAVLSRLGELGIDLNAVTRELEDDGVEKFARPFDSLMRSIELKRVAALA